jgi:hypothetical protein
VDLFTAAAVDGADNVALVLQAKLVAGDKLEEAGLSAMPKPRKEE